VIQKDICSNTVQHSSTIIYTCISLYLPSAIWIPLLAAMNNGSDNYNYNQRNSNSHRRRTRSLDDFTWAGPLHIYATPGTQVGTTPQSTATHSTIAPGVLPAADQVPMVYSAAISPSMICATTPSVNAISPESIPIPVPIPVAAASLPPNEPLPPSLYGVPGGANASMSISRSISASLGLANVSTGVPPVATPFQGQPTFPTDTTGTTDITNITDITYASDPLPLDYLSRPPDTDIDININTHINTEGDGRARAAVIVRRLSARAKELALDKYGEELAPEGPVGSLVEHRRRIRNRSAYVSRHTRKIYTELLAEHVRTSAAQRERIRTDCEALKAEIRILAEELARARR